MADFCQDCDRRLGLPEPDIKADPGSTTWDVCESCGPGWFDEHGKRVTEEPSQESQQSQEYPVSRVGGGESA
jgi:hypothetical protein